MIKASFIIEALNIIRTRHGNKPLAISVNPSSISEVLRDIKDDIQSLDYEAQRFRATGELRFCFDLISGDLFVWNALRAIHDDVVHMRKGIAGILEFRVNNAALLSRRLVGVPEKDFGDLNTWRGFDCLMRILSEFEVGYGEEMLGGVLHRLVRNGDIKRIKAVCNIINKSRNKRGINYVDPNNNTPYYIARKMGEKEIADYLKSVGGNVGFFRDEEDI